jgi:lipopolysaccharide biosynthesis glycosyltransferase
MDCDMLMRSDIADLWTMRDDRFSVMCIKHDHQPRTSTKFLGNIQTKYEMKNWSSVMLLNSDRCRMLTPELVNQESGLFLHQFKWLPDRAEIGSLPSRWNYLVGESPPETDPALVHFTLGGPYFEEYANCEFAEEWRAVRERLLRASPHPDA